MSKHMTQQQNLSSILKNPSAEILATWAGKTDQSHLAFQGSDPQEASLKNQ